MEFNLMAAPKKGGSGRRKIAIEKIANEEALQVCFSKRRRGLFKKAAELSTLCGVDLAAVVFSPGGKAFTFGHPNVGCVLDRYLNPTLLRLAPAPYDPAGEALLGSLMGECEALRQMVDAHSGKKRAGAEEALWWAAPLDGVGLDQLVARKEMTQALRRDVLARIGELERVERSVHGGE